MFACLGNPGADAIARSRLGMEWGPTIHGPYQTGNFACTPEAIRSITGRIQCDTRGGSHTNHSLDGTGARGAKVGFCFFGIALNISCISCNKSQPMSMHYVMNGSLMSEALHYSKWRCSPSCPAHCTPAPSVSTPGPLLAMERHVRMVPSVLQQVFRPKHGDRRLLRDQLRGLQRRGDDLVPAAGHDARDEPALLRLRRGEGARGERELGDEALVARHLWHARERADVGGEADVDFLFRKGL